MAWWRRGASVLLSLVVLSAAVVSCSAGDDGARPVPGATGRTATKDTTAAPTPDLTRFYRQRLSWHGCGGGFECTKLVVPVDYTHPTGATLKVAVNRLKASGDRIGSLLVNPGGPGVSGVQYAKAATQIVDGVIRRHYDIVGFDPRGIGASDGLHCLSDKQIDAFLAYDGTPDDAAEEQGLVHQGQLLAAGCEKDDAQLLAHIGTRDVARDLDVLRAAVGDPKLTFAGHSYGSHLAATYANLFPQRVRALVLDGVLESSTWMNGIGPFSLRVGSQDATSRALRHFLETCQQAGPDCAFSDGDPVKEFDALMARLRSAPIGPFGYADVVNIMRDVLGFTPAWKSTAESLAAVRAGEIPPAAAAAPEAGPDDAKLAIACSETDNPRLPQLWPLAARVADHFTPYFGASWAYISQACATWPARDADRYAGPFNRKTAAPLLLVNSRFDAASSYERAQRVERTLGSARLLTIEGAGHTQATIDSPCADRAIERYLIAGELPAPGAVCADQRDPWAAE
jgi:pimeloyl-ACP methyl ester carboxylesterase